MSSVKFPDNGHYRSIAHLVHQPKGKGDIGARPWLDDHGCLREGWSPCRIWTAKVVQSKAFESCLSVVILFNVALMCAQANYEAQCHPSYNGRESECPYKNNTTLRYLNVAFLAIYSMESACRLFALRIHFLEGYWNLMDVFIVALGWVSEFAQLTFFNLTYLRIIRLARLIRAFQVAIKVRELYLMLNGIVSSIRAIGIGTLSLFGMLLTYSIVLVELVHPYNSSIQYEDCPGCEKGFSSVFHAVMTLFKALIAGDSWIVSMQLLEGRPFLAPIMIFVVITITLGMMNLILTVIVERATDAREKDIHSMALHKMDAQRGLKEQLIALCKEIDEDEDGRLTSNELLAAFEHSHAFRDLMTALDVHPKELEVMLKVMDKDDNGYLDYEEFCDEVSRFKSFDRSMMLVLLKFSMRELQNAVKVDMEHKLHHILLKTQLHEALLASMNRKLDNLMKSVSQGHNTAGGEEQQFQRHPTIAFGSLPQSDEKHHMCEAQLTSLHDDIQRLVRVSDRLVEQVTNQRSTLHNHAEVVSSFKDLLPKSSSAKEASNGSQLPTKAMEVSGPLIANLEHNLQIQKCLFLDEMQNGVEKTSGVLDHSTLVLNEMQSIFMPDNQLSRQGFAA